MSSPLVAKYVVIGGGISGVTCAEYLSHFDPEGSIILIAATDVIKTSATARKLTELVEEREIVEKTSDEIQALFPNVLVVIGFVVRVDAEGKKNGIYSSTSYVSV